MKNCQMNACPYRLNVKHCIQNRFNLSLAARAMTMLMYYWEFNFTHIK